MKALVLFSGGVDSTTCLGLAVDKYGADQVLALSVSYGQKHQKEVEAAGKIAAHYGVKWQQLDLSVIFADSNCSLLSGSTQEIPKETYAEQLQETNGSPVSTYVPFRNGLFLSSAASCAISSSVSVKSNRTKFSRICSGRVPRGMTAMPFCVRKRSRICAGVFPYFLASASTAGS